MIRTSPLRLPGLVGSLVVAAGCGGSPAAPSRPAASSSAPPQSSVYVVTGTAVDALSEEVLSGVVVSAQGLENVSTGPDGRFAIEVPDGPGTPVSSQGVLALTLQSPATVLRVAGVRVPGSHARLSLIPDGFDVPAFDQMFRHTGWLKRWVVAPGVVLQRRVLQFTSASDDEFVATDILMSDEHASELLTQLASALPDLTGGHFGAFANEQQETAAVGESVSVIRGGTIVVAQYRGLTAASGSRGFGRFAANVHAVQTGVIMLDRTFDTSGSQFTRALRVHELGHALGYGHVTARESVMNPSAQLEPNAFDRDAAKVGFEREPGSRTPDMDSLLTVANPDSRGGFVWWPPFP